MHPICKNIANQLAAGKDFNDLAKQYSDDTISAVNSGVLDWYSQGTLDPVFEKAAANLQNVGDVSAPVRTKYGFSIIKLLGVQKPQQIPFAQALPQVQNALAQQQAEQGAFEERRCRPEEGRGWRGWEERCPDVASAWWG